MNTTITVFPHTDTLMDEYNRLAMLNEIADMARYAAEWALLALKANSQNRPALAAHASAHAEHYAQYDPGEYIKLVEGPLAEMIFVDGAYPRQQQAQKASETK